MAQFFKIIAVTTLNFINSCLRTGQAKAENWIDKQVDKMDPEGKI